MKVHMALAALASMAALATTGCVPPHGGASAVPVPGAPDHDHYSYRQRPLTVEEESVRITAAQERASPWFEGLDAIARWAPGTECNNVHSRKAEQSIGALEVMTVLFSKGGEPMKVYEKEAQESRAWPSNTPRWRSGKAAWTKPSRRARGLSRSTKGWRGKASVTVR